jgi:hypothetical protein
MYDLMSIENTIPYDKVNFDELKFGDSQSQRFD